MTGQARGEDYSIYLIDPDGGLVKTIQPMDMNFRPDEERSRQERCGTRRQPVRQVFRGWEGDATFEKEDHELDKLIDAQEQAYYNGQPIEDIEIVQNKYVPKSGTTETYRYVGVKLGYREEVPGQKEDVTQQLEWQAERREKI